MNPFMTEQINLNIVCNIDAYAPESVQLCSYPEANEAWIDKQLEDDMEDLLKIVVMGRACRNSANLKNRQPLAKMFIKAPFTLSSFYTDIIEDELNVKSVEFTDDVRAFTTYNFKPQLKTVGPKYGKLLGQIRQLLPALDGNAAMDELIEKGAITLHIDGTEVILEKDDLLIEMTQMPGYVTENSGDVTVVLDSNLTEELIEEGYVRELISKIQTMRKEADFEVTDHITVAYAGSEKIAALMERYAAEIQGSVLADRLTAESIEGYTKEWDINGETVTLTVQK